MPSFQILYPLDPFVCFLLWQLWHKNAILQVDLHLLSALDSRYVDNEAEKDQQELQARQNQLITASLKCLCHLKIEQVLRDEGRFCAELVTDSRDAKVYLTSSLALSFTSSKAMKQYLYRPHNIYIDLTIYRPEYHHIAFGCIL